MTALITGAGSGIGREFARVLSKMGYNIIAVGRRREKLEQLKNELDTDVVIYSYDLSHREQCFELFEKTKDCDIDIVINNAGFGVFGKFCNTDINRELSMIDTNITAVHILTKLYVQKFTVQGKGRVLNVASSAGYMMGPCFSSYYA
ncbi:MAG: SDR family NAD(P)-dependent oxidoreductase, partial [Clostridia bacterium]|nr:SDR family NAD(P)-dependent oxidoreductase [Clostridia bacterium]